MDAKDLDIMSKSYMIYQVLPDVTGEFAMADMPRIRINEFLAPAECPELLHRVFEWGPS